MKLFLKYGFKGSFIPFTTCDNWHIKKFNTEKEMLNYISELCKTRIPIHCAKGYYQKETINKKELIVLKYKLAIYEG